MDKDSSFEPDSDQILPPHAVGAAERPTDISEVSQRVMVGGYEKETILKPTMESDREAWMLSQPVFLTHDTTAESSSEETLSHVSRKS